MKPDPESASLLAEALAEEADFATEHRDLTVGDHERGGPEGSPERESPKGYGGADIHPSRRPRERHAQVVMALSEPHSVAPEPVSFSSSAESAIPEIADPEPEPDFATEHQHLTVDGGNQRARRR